MAPKTIKKALADILEDLSDLNLEKFRHQLVDRREEPRVRRNKVEGKTFLQIADVLVSTFTEARVVGVAVELLQQIECYKEAAELVEETGGQSSAAGSSDNEHFVDKHQLELVQRVSNIAPILDALLHKKVIDQESYDKIRAQPTSQDKMRMLYSGCLKAGRACKDIFYTILEKNEQYLIADLKN